MPGMSGLDLLGQLTKTDPSAVPVVVTGHGTVDSAVESMKLGAFDFLTKPFEPEKLLETVRRGLSLSALKKEAQAAGAAEEQRHDKYDLLLQGLDVLGEAYSLGLENGSCSMSSPISKAKHGITPKVWARSRRRNGQFWTYEMSFERPTPS